MKLQAGESYLIDLKSDQFDTMLKLYEAKGKLLTVARKQPVEVIYYYPNANPFEKPHPKKKTHSFSFTFGPRLDPADYEVQSSTLAE